ncbi:MAG: hypothetical protein ABJD05_16500, partial [Roseibium sp.]|uniref:hypothetical protein n=1 Tax=Roseibium sp. TaxID=1936156 RepID=UPI003264143A
EDAEDATLFLQPVGIGIEALIEIGLAQHGEAPCVTTRQAAQGIVNRNVGAGPRAFYRSGLGSVAAGGELF